MATTSTANIEDDFTPEQLKEYREAFSIFDNDGDNSISTSELTTVMRSLGHNPTQQEVIEMIREVDENQNGKIEFQEFLLLMRKKLNSFDSEEMIRAAFRAIDTEGDGFITISKLKHVVKTLDCGISDEDLHEMVEEADTEGNGRVSYEDLIHIFTADKDDVLYQAYMRNKERERQAAARRQKYRRRHVACGPEGDDEFKAAFLSGQSSNGQVPNMKSIAQQYDERKYDRFSRQNAPGDARVIRKPGNKVPMSRTRMMFLQRTGQYPGNMDGGTESSRFKTDISPRRGSGIGSINDDKQDFNTKFVSKPPPAYQHVQSRLLEPRKTPRKDVDIKAIEKQPVQQLAGKTITINIGKEFKRLQSEGKVSNSFPTKSQAESNLATIGSTRLPVFPTGYAAKKDQRKKDMLYYEMWRTAFVKAIREIRCAEEKNERRSSMAHTEDKAMADGQSTTAKPSHDRKLFVPSSSEKGAGIARSKQSSEKETVAMPVVAPLLLQSPEAYELEVLRQEKISYTHRWRLSRQEDTRRREQPTNVQDRKPQLITKQALNKFLNV